MAAIGVSGLMLVANQYRKALGGTPGADDASMRALRLVDGFVAARAAEKAVVARDPDTIRQLSAGAASAYRSERGRALSAHGMTYEEYAAVRAAWRRWKTGKIVTEPGLAAAFRAREGALGDAEMGAIEPLDDGIR